MDLRLLTLFIKVPLKLRQGKYNAQNVTPFKTSEVILFKTENFPILDSFIQSLSH